MIVKHENVVVSSDLHCILDLQDICRRSLFVTYNKSKFPGLIWRHKKIKGTCLMFKSGKIVCNGVKSFSDAKTSIRQYSRLVQKLGYKIQLSYIKLVTITASSSLDSNINLKSIYKSYNSFYEPEIFPSLRLKLDGISYSIFKNGKVVITGIKSASDIADKVQPSLIDFSLF